MKHTYIYLLLIFLLQSVSLAEMRVWHLKDGTSFVGEYDGERLNRYYFKDQEGKSRNVLVQDVVPADERYIRTVVPPDIRLKFSKKDTVEKGRANDREPGTVHDGTLQITKTSREPFYGTLTVELYYVGEEFATDDFMMLARKKETIKFPDEKTSSVEIFLRGRTRVYTEYGGAITRGRTFGGYAALVFSSKGELIEFDTNINWLTEDKLDAFRSFPEFIFFDENCKKRPVPRPEYYTGRGFMS